MSNAIMPPPPASDADFEETNEMPAPSPSSAHASSTPASGTAGVSYQLTDLGNAERLVGRHGRDLRFTGPLGWLAWDGKRWTPDESGETMRRAKDTVRAIYAEAAMLRDSGARKDLAEHAIGSEHCSRLHAMVNLAESEAAIALSASKLDADPWSLNAENGTIELTTGTLRPHRREDLITKMVPVVFDASGQCPRWEQFLEEVQPDASIRAYLKRLAGYSATGAIREHVLPILYGSGRNGKGVYTNTLHYVLGEYARTVPTELLMAKMFDDHPTGRMVLFGCRLAVAAETEQNRGLATALVKQLTGGDPIAARYMRKDFVTFLPTHKLLLSTNYRPVIKETKDAIWDRVHLIPWDQRFLLGRQDKQLAEKLKAEASGILRWIVEGCLEWQRIGLSPPATVIAATVQYRKDMDLLGDFLAECCVLDPSAQVSRPTLRRTYERWAEEIGQRNTLDPKGFADALRERGCIEVSSLREEGRKTPVRGWRGIRVRTEVDDVDTYTGEDSVSGKHSEDARYEAPTPEEASTREYVSTGETSTDAPATAAADPASSEDPVVEREVFEL